MLGFLPGMSLEDAVTREIRNRQVSSDRSKSTNYNWQDQFGGFLGGYSRADVEREMQKQLDRKVKDEYDDLYLDTKSRLGDQLNPLYTGEVTGKTIGEIKAQQAQDERRATNLETLKLIPGNESLTVNPNASSTTLQGLITTATNNRRLELNREQEAKQAKIYARADEKEARLRADALRQQMRQDKQTEANRAQQFQIQQMQLGLENRRLDMQEARNFRQDRQKAIMQIMQGFQQMGNAFAY